MNDRMNTKAGKAKAGMVHSVSGWTRGVQGKLWDPLKTRAIPERLRGAFTTRRYTNPRLPLPLLLDVQRSKEEWTHPVPRHLFHFLMLVSCLISLRFDLHIFMLEQ